MVKDLVIVESPAKARTVGRFLGKNFDVKASMGHVRDLPKSKMGIDIDEYGLFQVQYVVMRDRNNSKIVKEIREAAVKANTVYLATDPDREGEAIAWHLLEAAKIDPLKTKRVVFHEITKPAVEEAFANTRDIDQDLVDAQQARRVLDRLVGYKLSPVLWKKIQYGTSAGRVQSVALRIVVDREHEINAFVPVEYWTISTDFSSESNKDKFKAELVQIPKQKGKLSIKNEDDALQIISELNSANYIVSKYETKPVIRRPSAPFITSTLQQEASRKLRFTSSRTMSLAQQLYEGIPLGSDELDGLITYMRTDSTNVSTLALAETTKYIKAEFGNAYTLSKPRSFSKKVQGAQEAHEAIRPTSTMRTPESIQRYLDPDQFKLYELIWKRMVSSQMTDSIYDRTTVEITASSDEEYVFRATGSVLKFDGFRKLYIEQQDDVKDDESNESTMPLLSLNQKLSCGKLMPDQHFTEHPPRFNEASLIKTLEKEGIGRPSTYATIVQTIVNREYVQKTQGRFEPSKLGIIVSDFLKKHFENIMDIGFTSAMEKKLDDVANGTIAWNPMLREFYQPFDETVIEVEGNAERVPREDLWVESGHICQKCERPMLVKSAPNYIFYGCSGFPDCDQTLPVLTGISCPKCIDTPEVWIDGTPGAIKEMRYRGQSFYGCTNWQKDKSGCSFSLNAKPLSHICPQCSGILVQSGQKNVRCPKPNAECDFKGPISDFELVDDTSDVVND